MRRTTAPALVLAAILLFAGACGNDDDDSAVTTAAVETTSSSEITAATDTTATATGADVLQVSGLEPEAGKYAFEGMPATLTAGVHTIAFANKGGEPHELGMVQIEGDQTIDDFLTQVVESEGAPFPSWLLGHTGVGETGPAGTTTATVRLKQGTYLFYCQISDKDDVAHAKNGMAGVLTVEGDSGGDLPTTDASVTITDYAFDLQGLKAGENTVKVDNTGKEFHHVLMFPIVGDATLADVKAFVAAPPPEGGPATETTAAGPPPPIDFDKGVGSTVLGPGEAYVTTLTLAPGRYVVLCFISDKAGGPPHGIAHDMIEEVTIA